MTSYLLVTCLLTFASGLGALILAQYARRIIFATPADRYLTSSRTVSSEVYGLQHGVLNLSLPASSMWMNMGFWRDQASEPVDFPKACKSLLEQVIAQADLLRPLLPLETEWAKTINLLDVGFGCGDQTIELVQGMRQDKGLDSDDKSFDQRRLHIGRYVGITNNQKQFLYARERLASRGLLQPKSASQELEKRVDIFCENAARPDVWSKPLLAAVKGLQKSSVKDRVPDLWLLGLDTLYHFAPSRLALLKYVHDEIEASFMAFDLVAEKTTNISVFNELLLRVVCLLTGTPRRNLVDVGQYRAMLIKSGYKEENISFTDISKDVFLPLAQFLDIQDRHLKVIGKGIGPFHVAKFIFRWWGTTGLIRGNIIVAKHTKAHSLHLDAHS